MSTLAAVLGFAVLFAAFGILGVTIGRWNRQTGCAGDGHGCAACHWSERECPVSDTGLQTTTGERRPRRAGPGPPRPPDAGDDHER